MGSRNNDELAAINDSELEGSLRALEKATSLMVLTGAGMGVDSGLPDFRGPEGFWRAYPHYEKLGVRFEQMANPQHFQNDPHFAWGFYGHRLNMYRDTKPHAGYSMVKKWAQKLNITYFAVTSNVDGHFQIGGYESGRVFEVHGSLNHLQCRVPCCRDIWANDFQPVVDFETMRSQSIPYCPHCGEVSRPNILMFGDWDFLEDRTQTQQNAFSQFLENEAGPRPLIIEIGAGTAVPTIRHYADRLNRSFEESYLLRINLREATQPAGPGAALAAPGLAVLTTLDRRR